MIQSLTEAHLKSQSSIIWKLFSWCSLLACLQFGMCEAAVELFGLWLNKSQGKIAVTFSSFGGGKNKKPKGCGCCVQECRPKCCWFKWVWGLRQSFLASAVHLRSWNHYTAVRKWKYLLVFVWNSCRCTSVVTGPSLRLVKPIQKPFSLRSCTLNSQL